MGFFDFIENSWDEISGNKDRRHARWREQTRVDAKKNRIVLVICADKFFKIKKNNSLAPIIDDVFLNMKMFSALSGFLKGFDDAELAIKCSDIHSKLALQGKICSLNYRDDKKFFGLFEDLDEFMDDIEYKFYYDNGNYYIGREDRFVDHIDNLMNEYLKDEPDLLDKWYFFVEKVREVRI